MKVLFLTALFFASLSAQANTNFAISCGANTRVVDDAQTHLFLPQLIVMDEEGNEGKAMMAIEAEAGPRFADQLCQSCGWGTKHTQWKPMNFENGGGFFAFFNAEGLLSSLRMVQGNVNVVGSLSCTR